MLQAAKVPFKDWLCDRNSRTHIFQAAHEVVADRGARQVSRVQAAPDVEEVVRAQHGIVLLGVTRGGEDPVHQDRHLVKPSQDGMRSRDENKKRKEILSQTERSGLIISRLISWFVLSSP